MLSLFVTFIALVSSLSWVCEYSELSTLTDKQYDFVLYKEDNQNVVKWLEKYDYCRAKGDTSVYSDAGQGKCEYSRGICIWSSNSCILNPSRGNDPLNECFDLLNQNTLEAGLDSGRNPVPVTNPNPVPVTNPNPVPVTNPNPVPVPENTLSINSISTSTTVELKPTENVFSNSVNSYNLALYVMLLHLL